MEICIEKLLPRDLSRCFGSIATHGTNAATETFEAAKETGAKVKLLDTPEKIAAVQQDLKESGFSGPNLNNLELNGVFIQMIAAELSEMGLDSLEELKTAFDGDDEQDRGGRLFWGIDDKPYYYAGT